MRRAFRVYVEITVYVDNAEEAADVVQGVLEDTLLEQWGISEVEDSADDD